MLYQGAFRPDNPATAMLQIDISSFKQGLFQVDLEPDAAALDLDPAVFSDLSVSAHLDVAGDRVLAVLTVEATARLVCDRTLASFEQRISGKHSLLFVPPGPQAASAETSEDVQVLMPSEKYIDITDVVRDTLMLALPIRRVAPGAEEAELETRFGSPGYEADIDPRWEALRALRSSDTVD